MAVVVKGDKAKPIGRSPFPPRLTTEEIQETLERPLPKKTRNPVIAQRELADARTYFRDRDVSTGYLYRSIKHFKLFEALSGPGAFSVDDERTYREAIRILAGRIDDVYSRGYSYSRDGNLLKAKAAFGQAAALIPVKSEPEPEDENLIWDNVRQHLTNINGRIEATRGRSRGLR